MASDAEPTETGLGKMVDLNLKDEPDNEPSSTAPASTVDYLPPISNNDPNFRYKYPGAKPTPPGVDDTEWNKIYTAADSRFYNKHGKSSTESKKYRDRGETYTLALKMLEEKREKKKREEEAGGPTPKPKKPAPAKKLDTPSTIKKEPSTSSRDVTPGADMTMGIAEKIKNQGRARKAPSAAPSSDRGTPAPVPGPSTSVTTPPKMGAPELGGRKKGTAMPVKKAKDSSQSKPKSKSQVKSAPVSLPKIEVKVTPASSRVPSQTPGPRTSESTDDESNDGGEYCICRGPDDHRMMVNCEGGCDDWYHCSCVGIDEVDTKELLDKFVCPNCTTATSFTTWKPMCRYGNVGRHLGIKACRKAARVGLQPTPSKYCSDEHSVEFWRFVKSQMRNDDEPSKGGALSQKEAGWILGQCKTVEEVQALGAKPRLPKKDGADLGRPVGHDYLTPGEEQDIVGIKSKKAVIQGRIEGYQKHQKVLQMINKRSKVAAQQPNLEIKDLCGYDSRLALNETEFAIWCNSEEGKVALATANLSPRTEETKHLGAHRPYPGQVVNEPAIVSDALKSICLKARKKCTKHANWREIHNQDFVHNQNILKGELAKLSKTEAEIIDDAETREATKGYYSNNTTEQLF